MSPRLGHDGRQLLYTSVVFLSLDVLTVTLRILAKGRTKARFTADDLWIISALVVFAAWNGLIIGSKHRARRWTC